MKAALIEARGDLWVAAQLLGYGVTALRLERAIRVSPALMSTLEVLREESSKARNQALTTQEVEEAIRLRMALYRVSGMDALHELATMPIDGNSAQNQVKLAAAARLAGPPEGAAGGGEMAEALRALNDEYHRSAPKIRVIRQTTTVEISGGEPEPGQTIEGETPSRAP